MQTHIVHINKYSFIFSKNRKLFKKWVLRLLGPQVWGLITGISLIIYVHICIMYLSIIFCKESINGEVKFIFMTTKIDYPFLYLNWKVLNFFQLCIGSWFCRPQNPGKFCFSSEKVLREFRKSCGRIMLILMGLPPFLGDSWNYLRKTNTEKINFTNKRYFLLHKTSI